VGCEGEGTSDDGGARLVFLAEFGVCLGLLSRARRS